MNTQVVFLAAVTVLIHVSAVRGFSVGSRNEDGLDAGDGTGTRHVSRERDVSDLDLDPGSLVPVKESVRNDLHDIRRREASSEKRSHERQEESEDDEPEEDQEQKPGEKVLKDIASFLEPKKEMIINFMRPIIDRIKNKFKPGQDNPPDSPTSPAPTTPPDSSSTPSDPDASTPSDSDASATSASHNSSTSGSMGKIFPPFHLSFSKCGADEKTRSMDALSLMFPDLRSNEGEQPFVSVPLTNTLMRVVEQQIIKETQTGGDPKRKL